MRERHLWGEAMSMSPRLLRPRQTLHPEAASWAARVVANGGTVSGTTLSAVDKFCKAIASAGIRDRFYRLNLFAGNSDASLNAVRTPLFRGPSLGGTQYGGTTDTNNNFVAGDYAENSGLAGNGSTKYLNTGFPTNTLQEGNRHISAYEQAKSTGLYQFSIGSEGASANSQWFSLGTFAPTDNYRFGFGSASGGVDATSYSGGAMWLGSNAATGSGTLYKNGVSAVTGSLTAATPTSSEMWVFTLNRQGTSGGPSNARLGSYSLGLGMNATQAAAYYTAMQAFQTALGRNV